MKINLNFQREDRVNIWYTDSFEVYNDQREKRGIKEKN